MKIKREKAVILPEKLVSKYLNDTPALVIDPPPPSSLVSRRFLRETYGGSDQAFIAHGKRHSNPSSDAIRNFVFPTPDVNPDMPISPGYAGLLLSCRHEILENGPWTLFRRVQISPALWEYCGEYENSLAGSMSSQDFTNQRHNVRFILISIHIQADISSHLLGEGHLGGEDYGSSEMGSVYVYACAYFAAQNQPFFGDQRFNPRTRRGRESEEGKRW